jgi:hypothetical protein
MDDSAASRNPPLPLEPLGSASYCFSLISIILRSLSKLQQLEPEAERHEAMRQEWSARSQKVRGILDGQVQENPHRESSQSKL